MADAKAFTRAFSAPVPVAELEVLRARHNVARVAAMLRHLGLTAESERVLRLATQLGAGDIDAVRRLAGELRRRRSLWWATADVGVRSEEHTSELQSLMRISYAVFCLKKKQSNTPYTKP